MQPFKRFIKQNGLAAPLNGHNGCNVRKMADFEAVLILIGFLLQCFDLVGFSQIMGVKTGKNDKKNLKIKRLQGFLVEISGIEPLTS